MPGEFPNTLIIKATTIFPLALKSKMDWAHSLSRQRQPSKQLESSVQLKIFLTSLVLENHVGSTEVVLCVPLSHLFVQSRAVNKVL